MSSAKPHISISAYDYPPEELLALARAAESLGFEGLWCGEHYVVPARHKSRHPANEVKSDYTEDDILASDVRLHDPWFLLGAAAGITTSLKIGTAICVAPLNHPLILARASVTAHDVSRGRFRFGVGTGWLREEFDALGASFEDRGGRLDETIDILRQAWAGGFFEHRGKHFQFERLQITPERTEIPLVCAGNTGPALRRIARVGDAWMNSAFITLDEALRLRDGIELGRREALTSHRPFTYFIRPVKPDGAAVERFSREGFDHLVLWGPDVWPADPMIPRAEKTARLAAIAREFGVQPASVEAISP